MLYALVIAVHVFVCFVLIFVILLQAGRGGGLSQMWGGGQPQSLFGTQTNLFMTRATEVCAVVFIVTSLVFGIMTSQRGKSLIQKETARQALQKSLPAIPLVSPEKKEAPASEPKKEERPDVQGEPQK
ncbi:MAG: preprotein translocase subunit SecG [Candidatus Omnitrophica bacterium]|nr:preprotein translocase subunit SecG [Candidatus Omnitrophota bacterium]